MEPWFGPEEKQAVAEYLDSNAWLTEFKKTEEFEARIAHYVGSKYCVATVNGTIALTMAVMASGIGPGDEVLVPDYTMIATANSVRLAGATPVFVDIDPATSCMDIQNADRAITPRTKALMLVSINGRSPDMDAFAELCQKRNVLLLEDAAQSLGSRYKGKHLGSFGFAGCFSFSVPKVITTGQGGAVVTDDAKVFEKLRLVKDFGRERAGVDVHIAMGYNFKFTDLQAVIGIEQMKKLPWRVERKKEMYRLYQRLLADIREVVFPQTDLGDTSPWFVDILVPRERREALMGHLKDKGVGSRPFYPPIHSQKPYASSEGAFSHSVDISRRGLWLPSSSFLNDEDIHYVSSHIREFFSESPLKLST